MTTEGIDPFADFEQSLNEWLARAIEPPSELTPQPTEPVLLRMVEDRLRRLQTYLDEAERDAEQALTPLAGDIQMLQKWLEALCMARARLLERTVRRVG